MYVLRVKDAMRLHIQAANTLNCSERFTFIYA